MMTWVTSTHIMPPAIMSCAVDVINRGLQAILILVDCPTQLATNIKRICQVLLLYWKILIHFVFREDNEGFFTMVSWSGDCDGYTPSDLMIWLPVFFMIAYFFCYNRLVHCDGCFPMIWCMVICLQCIFATSGTWQPFDVFVGETSQGWQCRRWWWRTGGAHQGDYHPGWRRERCPSQHWGGDQVRATGGDQWVFSA